MKMKSKKTSFKAFELISFFGVFLFILGCQSSPDDQAQEISNIIGQSNIVENADSKKTSDERNSLVLHEGDTLNISFLGAPDLNTVQTIRRDGKITIQIIGELTASGMTPVQLENEIVRLCGPQLISKEVRVTVSGSQFPIFITGAVLRPGKIMSDRPITALQAIMEAGGPDYARAKLTSVLVIRQEGRDVKHHRINLKLPLQGKKSDPFDLKPADILYVPERFAWF